MTKKIAVYGMYRRIETPPRQRRLVTRRDGIKQHYWYGRRKPPTIRVRERRLITRRDGVKQHYWVVHRKPMYSEKVYRGRYEFKGDGKDLYKAVVNAHQVMPKGYVSVSAEKFNRNPEKYGVRGVWIKYEVEYEPWDFDSW